MFVKFNFQQGEERRVDKNKWYHKISNMLHILINLQLWHTKLRARIVKVILIQKRSTDNKNIFTRQQIK